MNQLASPELLAAIDGIYAVAESQTHWNAALGRVADVVGAAGATIGYYETSERPVAFAASTTFSDEAIEYYARELVHEDPITPLVQQTPVGVTTLSHEVLDPRVWTRSRMYADLYEPNHVLYAMAGMFARERDRFGTLIVTQDRAKSRFSLVHSQQIDLLLPHVARSFRLSRLLSAARAESEIGNQAALFFDRSGNVIGVGPRAEQLLRSTAAFSIEERRFRIAGEPADAWLQTLLAVRGSAMAERAVEMNERGSLRWVRDEGVTYRLELLVCPPLSSWTDPGVEPATVLLIEGQSVREELPTSLLEVAELVAEGLSDKAIAEQTGRPLSTIRTYVTRLYERTGLRSRAAITKWWWTSR